MEGAIEKNYHDLRRKIAEACERVNRDFQEVKLIAVTKRISLEKIMEAVDLGITELGENRMQEALPKIPQISPRVNWHFVGHLQTNKVGDDLDNFCLLHSLDRLKLAEKIDQWAQTRRKQLPVLIQINVSGEASKFGLPPEELEDFLQEVLIQDGIEIKGLMTMAPWTENPEEVRPYFVKLRQLRDQVNKNLGLNLHHLSMGMTNDYMVAVEEGSTMVRLGTALFGSRE